MENERDYSKNPITAEEAIELFLSESFDLALATQAVIDEASAIAEDRGMFYVADSIGSRYDDYQEELRCMLEEFM
jgi:hypothetical protein